MAERRMFAKTIIDSDAFLDMPTTSQLLYFHLAMRADDDGFVNKPKSIMRMIGATQGDAEMLVQKKFVIPFESGVVVIKHWKIHNYIRKDMYKETKYKEEKDMLSHDENNAYRLSCNEPVTEPLQDCVESLTQDRLGQDRLGQDRLDYNSIKDAYNTLCPSLPSVKTLSDARKKAIKARLNTYDIDMLYEAFKKAEASDFLKGKNNTNWTANFDWIIKDANLAKILDGNYDNKPCSKAPSPSGGRLDWIDEIQ